MCHYHDLVAQANVFETLPKPSPSLPPNCTPFLKSVLKANPLLGHSLIKKLSCGLTPELVRNSKLLQRLYFDAIHLLLDELKQLKKEVTSVIEEEQSDECSSEHEESFLSGSAAKESDKVKNTVRTKMECVLDFLSFLNPSFIPGDSELDRLLVTLLKFALDFGAANGGVCQFEPGKLYSCLLGQSNNAIVVKLQEAEEFLRQNKSFVLPDMDPVGETNLEDRDPLKTVRDDWKEVFHKALHDNVHFLEDKMVSLLS